jgi:hypothetical protein
MNNQAEEDEMCGAFSTDGAQKNEYRLLVGKPKGKRPLGRPRRRRMDNINIYLDMVG